MKKLYFVRHGLSVMNKKGIFSGRTETPLSEEGVSQAQLAGQKLKALEVDCLVSSPMGRAHQTAELIAREIRYPSNKIIISELLNERDFGPLEGTPYEPDLGDSAGVETVAELIARADKAYDFLANLPYDNIVVVSHGAIGRALRHHINPEIPFKPSPGFSNAEIVELI